MRKWPAPKEPASCLTAFIGDRELLDCAHCGLQEDVLIDGRLVTYQVDAADAADSGLHFAAADDGNFVCPQCGAAIARAAADVGKTPARLPGDGLQNCGMIGSEPQQCSFSGLRGIISNTKNRTKSEGGLIFVGVRGAIKSVGQRSRAEKRSAFRRMEAWL